MERTTEKRYRKLARTGGDRACVGRDRMPPFQNDHDIVDCERLVDALAGRVASVADGDRPAVPLVDQIAREHVSLLPGGAFERRVGNRELTNGHGIPEFRLVGRGGSCHGLNVQTSLTSFMEGLIIAQWRRRSAHLRRPWPGGRSAERHRHDRLCLVRLGQGWDGRNRSQVV